LSHAQRRIYDADGAYLNALHAPNLHLTKEPILEIVPRGIRTATQTYPADVIVLATGFQTNNGLGALRIQGRNGEWLEDHWRKAGGAGAYNSTAVHGCKEIPPTLFRETNAETSI
jgi:cation diffusion facilitator CzcD-associated flavoprotein CzcO